MHPTIRLSRAAFLIVLALLTSVALGLQSVSHPNEQQSGLLYADLWMQTSAEYVACCLQTYRLAGDAVEHNVQSNCVEDNNLAPEFRSRPPAVIMDLDETVLDNATFQTYLYDIGANYTDELWSQFVTEHHASIRLVPGAKDFIDRVESLGVTVLYITNREELLRQTTIATLAQWGVNIKGLNESNSLRLLMQAHGESSKTARRDLVRAKYHVLALVGDQLGDFADEFTPNPDNTIAARRETVYEYRRLWGTRWFILPQPVYGQWQAVLRGNPQQYLRRAEK
jgi:5'-nucleotidase (lipoprotein e(P4) family)